MDSRLAGMMGSQVQRLISRGRRLQDCLPELRVDHSARKRADNKKITRHFNGLHSGVFDIYFLLRPFHLVYTNY